MCILIKIFLSLYVNYGRILVIIEQTRNCSHGRAIRCESDTAVVSILDGRANTRYKDSVISSLPNTPIVNDVDKIKEFIFDKKDESYFHKMSNVI